SSQLRRDGSCVSLSSGMAFSSPHRLGGRTLANAVDDVVAQETLVLQAHLVWIEALTECDLQNGAARNEELAHADDREIHKDAIERTDSAGPCRRSGHAAILRDRLCRERPEELLC